MSYCLDTRLENDTLPLGKLELCEVLLLNDARWPWLVLVPMRDNCSEIFDLSEIEQLLLAKETGLVSIALKKICQPEKINTGALGNIVRQLHVHLIARNENDANWPGPVWGFGKRQPYGVEAAETLISRLQSELSLDVL